MNIFHLKWTGCTIDSMYNQQHKNFYLNADPQKMSCAKDSENKGKRMAQAHSHPGMPSAGARVSQPYYIQGGILFAMGNLENGASLTQACYQTTSWSKSSWYSFTVGSKVYAFKTPSSGGSNKNDT